MAAFILAGCMLIIIFSVFASFQSSAGMNRTRCMSVALPEEYLKRQEVTSVVTGYRKMNRLLHMCLLLTIPPIVFMPYVSLQMLYLGVWMGLVFALSNRIYCHYNSRLILLKSRNLWFAPNYEYRTLQKEDCQGKRNALLTKFFPTPAERLLSQSSEPVYVDEDVHWMNGYYYNPKDPKSMVDKRVGIGSTSNMAKKGSRITFYGAIYFAVIVFTVIIVLFARMDFADFKMEIGDTKVEINAPMYSYDFALADVKSITLIHSLPEHMYRTNGAGTNTYYLGNFHIGGYGSSKVYLYWKNPPYIVIELPGKTVFYNTKSDEETMRCYDELKAAVNQAEE